MKSIDAGDSELRVIDVPPPRRRRRLLWLILAAVVIFFLLGSAVSVYVEALWFDSLGYASVYWYTVRARLVLFAIFSVLTFAIMRAAFWLLERSFALSLQREFVVKLNTENVAVSPGSLLRPAAWVLSLIFGLGYGLSLSAQWERFALYLNQGATASPDPVFRKPLGFYLFTLPVYEALSSWLTTLAFFILAGAVLYALLSAPKNPTAAARRAALQTGYTAVSLALAFFLLMLAAWSYLARFSYLWRDHQSFSGVTYMEANYLIPGLSILAAALIAGALISFANAFMRRGLRVFFAAVGLPLVVFVVATMLVPAYVTSFIVKPNELGREAAYIAHNIEWTRRAYGLDRVDARNFEAALTTEALDIGQNRTTLENIRLWDWRALQDTLRQVQEIRNYYEFVDVDVDRYRLNGQMRQVMVAARELDIEKLPPASRNWTNERLIYTHGYGVTMNPVNEFTPEGMPRFVLSDMPVASNAPEVRVARPQIYFGQKTDGPVYVRTRLREFDFPQGEANQFTTYEGAGGVHVGGFFRRLALAWALGDLSKLPFSDDVRPDSRVLMRRNIIERVNRVAPFLVYDEDPYIVVRADGTLAWIIDAYTESSNYPYSRSHTVAKRRVNYVRNSVKVVIDAYDGTTTFYVFDEADPLIRAYRAVFPALFRGAGEMPADLLAHVRYPETLVKAQAEMYTLYHTQDAQIFFQREDVWAVAREVGPGAKTNQESLPIEPYFVLMQLPGEQTPLEFMPIIPFTPANRNNMVGWLAGRSDGEAYGSLVAYNFPQSRVIDGPLQIEARIDQNAQLSQQLTLWNQQGSRVVRGNMLVIPIGRGLLYVKPIYLQSERSPMPELRLVVLATQERLAYGTNFEEALTGLLGDSARPARAAPAQAETPTPEGARPPAGQQPAATRELINRASEEFNAYQRHTAEGRLSEAGQSLEALKRTLEELRRQQEATPPR
jgi:uncharacterized membrane protein (UPF0182 family)